MKSFLMILCLTILAFSIIGIANSATTVNLGTAGNFVILSETGVTTTGVTQIVGNIGVSPIASDAITGFGLAMDGSGTFSTSARVTGKVYAADYAAPTPSMLTTAIGDMETAYDDAAGRAVDVTELGTGNIGGLTIIPGVYKWGTGVIIPADVILSGNANDVWIFQIAQTLNISTSKRVILTGGAQAKNIFWQVAGAVTLGTYSTFNGNILAKTNIALQTGAVLNGSALAQTEVTLDASNVTKVVDTVIINAEAGSNGSIDPEGDVIVPTGTNQKFTMDPDRGYEVSRVIVDGTSIGARSSYTFTNVTAPHTIEVRFTSIEYIINATAGVGGTISPSGSRSVDYDDDQTFTITPSTGYKIVDVKVDGASLGTITTYT
ncbi:MAG: hypothetical protein QG641_878, partial [Candidatus Poribacteria bacterium]|nr:hypothetical protein [Candidatus Poribacteria bacterium]